MSIQSEIAAAMDSSVVAQGCRFSAASAGMEGFVGGCFQAARHNRDMAMAKRAEMGHEVGASLGI